MPLQVTKLDSLPPAGNAMRTVVYGPAGVGKTRLASTFPRPILWLDFDDKMGSVKEKKDIDIIQYSPPDFTSCRIVFAKFRADLREITRTVNGIYKTIVLDSLSSLDVLAIRNFMLVSGKNEGDTPTLPTYGDLGNFYSFLFTELKALKGIHFILTAHESYDIDGESGIHSIQPLVTGGTVRKLPAMFQEVWYYERKGDEKDTRILHYRQFKKAIATSTLLQGNGEILDPTYEKIQALIKP